MSESPSIQLIDDNHDIFGNRRHLVASPNWLTIGWRAFPSWS